MLLLILLSIIWAGSFIFMRILAPIFGPIFTADFRLLVGGLVLLPLVFVIRRKGGEKLPLLFLLLIGIFNSGIPFLLYSFAALHIPGSISSIINSLTPVFGAIYAAIWLGERFSLKKGVGLLLGVSGVAVISFGGAFEVTFLSITAVISCILATNCYALSGVIIKRRSLTINPIVMASLTQIAAGLAILPLGAFSPIQQEMTPKIIIIVIVFGALCSGLAYVIYYRLITQEGPSRALSVTFLIPVFGIFWGRIILNEIIPATALAGMVVILLGTYLVVSSSKQKIKGEV